MAISELVMKIPVPTTEPIVSSSPSHVVRPRTRVGPEGPEVVSAGLGNGVAMAGILAVLAARRQRAANRTRKIKRVVK